MEGSSINPSKEVIEGQTETDTDSYPPLSLQIANYRPQTEGESDTMELIRKLSAEERALMEKLYSLAAGKVERAARRTARASITQLSVHDGQFENDFPE
jgi:hypothetical protein